jgi:hypothetical protein
VIDGPSATAALDSTGDAKAKRRPFGLLAIIAIQVLIMLGSVIILALVALAFVTAKSAGELAHLKLSFTAIDAMTLVFAFVVNGVCAVGLWWRKRWAWFLTMLQLGVFMISDLYSYFTDSPPETYAWSMLLNVFIVFYLNQREVQAIFLNKNEGKSWP